MEISEKNLVTGRRLDKAGQPIDGTGFEYDANGPVATALAARIGPIYSNPISEQWGFKLVDSTDTGGEYMRGLGVFRAGNSGTAEHFHPGYAEHFEVLQGEFEFTRGKEKRIFRVGEKVVVAKGVRHGFRCTGEGFGVFVLEARPAGRFTEFIPMLYGLGHDGKLSKSGGPRILQALALANALDNDTVFVSPPPAIMRPLAKIVGPLAERFGRHAANYERYKSDGFWEARVEQP